METKITVTVQDFPKVAHLINCALALRKANDFGGDGYKKQVVEAFDRALEEMRKDLNG